MFLSPGLLGTNPIQADQIRPVTDQMLFFPSRFGYQSLQKALTSCSITKTCLEPMDGQNGKKVNETHDNEP